MITSGGTATLGLYDNASAIKKKADITYVDNMVASIAGGHKGYATLALATTASTGLPANTVLEVTNDTTTSNNGLYLWNGSTLTKSNYDPVSVSKLYTDNINSVANKFRSSLVYFDEFPTTTNALVTFQKVDKTLKIFCSPTTGQVLSEWRADAVDFTSGKVSAQIRLSAPSGSSGTISLRQYDAGNNLLVTNNIATSLSGAINDVTYKINSITINPSTKYIGLMLDLGDSTNKVRIATVSQIAVSDGDYVGILPIIQNFLPKINVFPSPTLSKAKATTFSATSDNGVLTIEGSAQQEVTFDLNINGVVNVGSYLTFSADAFTDVVGKADVSLQCFNSSNVQLNTNVVIANTVINTWGRIETRVIVPVNTAYVRFRFVKRTTTSLAMFRNVFATSSDAIKSVTMNAYQDIPSSVVGLTTIYVSPTGSDSNNGKTKSNAVATVGKALSLASPFGRVIVAEGDYTFGRDGIASWAGFTQLSIEAERNARVRFISETKVTGISKTAGYTKVYQGTLLGTGYNPPRCDWIWHHDVPDPRTLIPASERLALQRGRTHRLESTKIEKVNSIAEIESSANPSWYHDAPNNTMYFSIWNGADATTADIRIPASLFAAFYGGTGTEKIKLIGIDVLYSGANGFSAQRLISFEAEHCRSLFNGDNGGAYDDCKFVQTKYFEYGGNFWDGGNLHWTTSQVNPYQMPIVYQAIDTWSHDNRDDGDSMHEVCLGTYWGGLYEYNGDRGIATAYGAHGTAYNTYARYNGQIDLVGGEGFAALGQLTLDTGVGTQMDCFSCVSIGNRYNYMASVSTSTVNAYDCISRDATGVGYRGDSGVVNAYDCKTFNDVVAKNGNVNIYNSSLLT